jgi:Polysaccharide lyase
MFHRNADSRVRGRPHRLHVLSTAILLASLFCVLLVASSATASRRHDWQPPSVPTSLAVASTSASSIELAWNASTDNNVVAGYTLFADGVNVGSTAALWYTFSGLACGTSYTLGVNAFDAAGNHSATATFVAATAACPTTTAPVNTSAPKLTGTPAVGSTLSASVGTWSGSPTSYAYQWQYCTADLSSCADIVGYTGSAYTPVPDDIGGRDRVKVTATNDAGSTVAYSSPTAPVVASATAPGVLSAPTIVGVAVAGQLLTATTGSWSGTPTSYAYQWRRCDLLGANCSPIAGATSGTYLLAALDVSSTLQVVVTASNAAGSTTAASAVTSPVQAATTAVTGSTGSPDFSADPNVTGSLAPWDKFDPGNAASTDGIWVSSQPSGLSTPGLVGIANDPLGLQGKVYQETVTPTSQASTASGSDSTYLFNHGKSYLGNDGQDNWVHFRMMLPAGYQPTPGEWNIFNEFHNNSDFISYYNSGSIGWEYPEIALYVTNYTGDVPHLMYRVRGGIDGASNFDGSDVLVPAQLQLNHWYDIMLHIVWSPTSTTGLFEWWLDGTKIASLHRPTLWQRPDGSTDQVELELNNYRQHTTYNSTVYYSKLKTGPSQASVGF